MGFDFGGFVWVFGSDGLRFLVGLCGFLNLSHMCVFGSDGLFGFNLCLLVNGIRYALIGD
jgi:hypothetical protein